MWAKLKLDTWLVICYNKDNMDLGYLSFNLTNQQGSQDFHLILFLPDIFVEAILKVSCVLISLFDSFLPIFLWMLFLYFG